MAPKFRPTSLNRDCVLLYQTKSTQFAKAAGARVIATTSSDAKTALLKKLGADHVLNYKSDPNWGETAKKLTYTGRGVDHVIEVGGPTTIAQSFQAIRPGGVITVIGFIGGQTKDMPSFLEVLQHTCIVRGALVGSRVLFEDMNRAIDATGLKPVVDEKVFELAELKEAYQYMVSQLRTRGGDFARMSLLTVNIVGSEAFWKAYYQDRLRFISFSR